MLTRYILRGKDIRMDLFDMAEGVATSKASIW